MLSFSAAWRSERPSSDRNRFSINFAAIVKCEEYDTIVLSGSVRIQEWRNLYRRPMNDLV